METLNKKIIEVNGIKLPMVKCGLGYLNGWKLAKDSVKFQPFLYVNKRQAQMKVFELEANGIRAGFSVSHPFHIIIKE